jgi:hypothetical protein
MNEHDEIRELLELAAVEPGGLDRLEAGDAPGATIVVGHVAGCPDCLEEMARLRRAETLLRPVLQAEPDPALRGRTLAYVRAVGVTRDPASTASSTKPSAPPDPRPGAEPVPAAGAEPVPSGAAGPVPSGGAGPVTTAKTRPRRVVGMPAWAGTLAAALVIGLVGGALIRGFGGAQDGGEAAVALRSVASETTTLLAEPDVRQVGLVDAAGTASGSLVLSPSTGHLLVVASGLDEPAAGMEYRCWVESAGARKTLGTMTWTEGVAWWSGDVEIPAAIPPGVVYGVSLVASGSSGPGTVVLTGSL